MERFVWWHTSRLSRVFLVLDRPWGLTAHAWWVKAMTVWRGLWCFASWFQLSVLFCFVFFCLWFGFHLGKCIVTHADLGFVCLKSWRDSFKLSVLFKGSCNHLPLLPCVGTRAFSCCQVLWFIFFIFPTSLPDRSAHSWYSLSYLFIYFHIHSPTHPDIHMKRAGTSVVFTA